MKTKFDLHFSRIRRTILILIVLSLFLVTYTYVLAQIGEIGDDLLGNTPNVGETITLNPVPGGPGFIMISALDFTPYDSLTPWAYYSAKLYNPSTTEASTMVSGLTLPHGATITQLTIYYKDDHATIDPLLRLFSTEADGHTLWMAEISSWGSPSPTPNANFTTEIDQPVVDNQNRSYALVLNLPANGLKNIEIINVRIDYAYTNFAPLVTK
ncbi:MAG: hypothetical protein GX544_05780 [Chloroflexi bacterium]|nr:hypothetical protein [Chloroflexota bacterium]